MYVLYLVYFSQSYKANSFCEINRYDNLEEAKYDYDLLTSTSNDTYAIIYQ